MSEAKLILKNMRGGCATVDGTVHTLFRFNGRLPRNPKAASKPAGEAQAQVERERVPAVRTIDTSVAQKIEQLAREVDAHRMERERQMSSGS